MRNELRLLDVFAFGPVLLYVGANKKIGMNPLARLVFVMSGITTITYNGWNYMRNLQKDGN